MDKYFEVIKSDIVNIIRFKISVNQWDIDKVFHQIENVSKSWRIIFDLWKVDFINSTFIWYMSHLHDLCQKNWWYLILTNCNPKVADIFNLTWILDIIPTYSSVDNALKNIAK